MESPPCLDPELGRNMRPSFLAEAKRKRQVPWLSCTRRKKACGGHPAFSHSGSQAGDGRRV